ncbi:PREDICTED: molybdopterin synthase catalytic subunit [Ceratosolen solmsi marchali]|uniref:Molybdopterin synthase catalytic subunit n=1 Tax=Ceratosolen solmsi marchali TaxID=326594 RepID=A0AAJ7DU06_9HYME|nr:PREDICTED: molybdopterin synthase catalytic subunit [Ceratosolen solmsi marchali]
MADLKNFVALEIEKLNVNDIIEMVASPNCGAISTFIGTTRDNFEEKKVVQLVYEAYEPMAIKELQAVCNKVRSQWNVEKIAIYHRLGEVSIMEASVVIAISSVHRQESLQAVQFTIDAIKSSVPIWKKEVYEEDEPQWKANKECFWTANDTKIAAGKTIKSNEESSTNEINYANVVVDDIEIDLDNVYETVEVKSENVNNDDQDDQDEDSGNEEFLINPDQIQIKADDQELNRRIESFIARKREQVNLINIQEFCCLSNQIQDDDNDDNTHVCARVNATFIRHKDVNHVKVHRVYNQWSQQNMEFNAPFKSLKNESNTYPSALEERLSVSEKILGINKPVPRDVYKRIKNIEDRLLFLESISPEYKDLWSIDDCDSVKSFDTCNEKTNSSENSKPTRKRTYSSTDPDSKLDEFDYRHAKIAK